MYMPPKTKKNANTLRFIPPGFKHSIDVPFPGRSLPVCERCKKNFKTREHCRTRDCHTGLPWSDTYVCITLDSSCLTEDGKLVEGRFMAKPVSPQPYCLKGDIDPQTPICAPCKDKNYTRTYCRSNKKHRQLPWSSVYVVLYHVSEGSQSQYPESSETQGGGESKGKSKRRKTNSGEAAPPAEGEEKTEDTPDEEPARKEPKKDEESENDETSKFDDIPASRTFLVTVSAKRTLIEWLDVDPMITTSTRERGDASSSRGADDGNFPSPYNMMPGGPNGGYPGPDDRYNRFPGQDMSGFDGHMPPYGYGRFPNEMMMPGPNRNGDTPQSQMPFDHRMMGMGWGQFNPDMSRMPYGDRSRGGMDGPPQMWGMPPFMRPYGPGGNWPEPGREGEGYNGQSYPEGTPAQNAENGRNGDSDEGKRERSEKS